MMSKLPFRKPEIASSHELKRYRQDRVKGLKIFMEARLLNDTFMDNHTQDEVKAMARRFDNKKRSDLFATRPSVLLSFLY